VAQALAPEEPVAVQAEAQVVAPVAVQVVAPVAAEGAKAQSISPGARLRRARCAACCVVMLTPMPVWASQEGQPKLPPGVTCKLVRDQVAEHGKLVAYTWATLNGYSKKDITEARKCLRSSRYDAG
jgi:hypothetical protein